MTQVLNVQLLNATDFSAYGDVLEIAGQPDKIINEGMCGRFHDRATLDFSDGTAGISMFDAKARHLPHVVTMVERHPEGSQAFVPVSRTRFMVVVADDKNGTPTNLKAFVTQPGQSINLHRGVWHGVLAPLNEPGQFIVIDRIGTGANLEEHWFDLPFVIESVPT